MSTHYLMASPDAVDTFYFPEAEEKAEQLQRNGYPDARPVEFGRWWAIELDAGPNGRPLDAEPDQEPEPGEWDTEPRCTNSGGHKFECTGTRYGGDDTRWNGEGRCVCVYCGADGDA
jgi:hypothetical protein